MWLQTQAMLLLDPNRPGLKKVRPGSLIVAQVDNSIAEYYRYWVEKRYGTKLQHLAFRPHVTLLDGKTPINFDTEYIRKKYHKRIIQIEYSVEVEQHWKFWCLPARSQVFTELRKDLGLKVDYPFHITIGRND